MERMIKVTGKGSLAVKPDQIRLMLEIQDSRASYEKTIELSTLQVEDLRNVFEELGFDRADLKTTYFNVDTKYHRYTDENGCFQNRFVGYEFTHRLKIEFDADTKRLGQILYALAHAPVMPEFRIVYTVKDVEASKNQLLGKAVADSKEKALVLTEAAGVKLGEIINIDYSWGEVEFSYEPMNRMMYASALPAEDSVGSFNMDIEPDDIDVSDTVTVIWSIQ